MSKAKNAMLAAAAVVGLLAGTTARAVAQTTDSKDSGKKADASKKDKAAKADKHDCKGKNSCKGKGNCKTGDAGCAGKNSCKGKGGCKTPEVKKDDKAKTDDKKKS